jgi:hypothetical protein
VGTRREAKRTSGLARSPTRYGPAVRFTERDGELNHPIVAPGIRAMSALTPNARIGPSPVRTNPIRGNDALPHTLLFLTIRFFPMREGLVQDEQTDR